MAYLHIVFGLYNYYYYNVRVIFYYLFFSFFHKYLLRLKLHDIFLPQFFPPYGKGGLEFPNVETTRVFPKSIAYRLYI